MDLRARCGQSVVRKVRRSVSRAFPCFDMRRATLQRAQTMMAAGVTDRLWEVADMVAVLEAWEANRRPYAGRFVGNGTISASGSDCGVVGGNWNTTRASSHTSKPSYLSLSF
jgi:hypothetical protein